MLQLVFQSGQDSYGLDISWIVEVLPCATLERVEGAQLEIAGLLLYRGTRLPVIDVAMLLTAQPARLWLSTRILILDMARASADLGLLGFMVERATEIISDQECAALAVGTISSADRAADQPSAIQSVNPKTILPESLKASLLALVRK